MRVMGRPFLLGLAALVAASCVASTQTLIATPTLAPLKPPPLATRAAYVVVASPTSTAILTPTIIALPSSALAPTPTVVLLPTATPAPLVLLPTVTPTPLPTIAPTALPVSTPAAWPATYRIQGGYASQTIYPDGNSSSQQGSFTILHQTVANDYGANQAYSLSARRADGGVDTSAIFLVDDYIAVTYAEGDWTVLRRDRGSSIVKAIRPITDLAVALLAAADRAEAVGDETIDGLSTRHIRLTAASDLARELVQPILGLSGDVRDLTLDAWVTADDGYVAQYTFEVEIAGARVFDEQHQAVLADQTVSWTYQLLDANAPLAIDWPEGAPEPGVLDVPGFVHGAFPLPPQTELISVIDGIPALLSLLGEDDLADFFRAELAARGWRVAGDTGLLRCTKGESAFQLLIIPDPAAGGTRVSVLPVP